LFKSDYIFGFSCSNRCFLYARI